MLRSSLVVRTGMGLRRKNQSVTQRLPGTNFSFMPVRSRFRVRAIVHAHTHAEKTHTNDT